VEADPIVGTEVAGFHIESVLGRGAMGVVYVARQRSPDRRVALKLIAPGVAGDEVFRRRFLREATAAAAIEHPHILPVYAAGESDGVLFLAMRLVDGRDLAAILDDTGPMPIERAERIVTQLGEALDAAHEVGLVHRDVKPGNILVTRPRDAEDADFCYLTDFGVSTWTASTAATITSTGELVGTANYIAPEQIEGAPVDGRADLYSLGCVLYQCVTGRPPFAGRGPAAILYAHVHEDARPPTSLRPDLPAGIDDVLAHALRKAPAERTGSGRELTRELRTALSPVAALAPRRSTGTEGPGRVRSRWRWAAAAVASAIVVAAGVALLTLRDDGPGHGPSSSAPPFAHLIREGVQAIASSTAPSSTDAAGDVVTYVARHLIDGDVETAWRTPGDGRGETITLIFDNPVRLDRIGLIPGYAKTDPQTGANRFLQDRIVVSVTYLVPGLPGTTKTFRPVPVPQFVPLHATTSRITIRILETTPSGGLDFTAISEIYVYGTQE
jgi:serine/threonine protein kinase